MCIEFQLCSMGEAVVACPAVVQDVFLWTYVVISSILYCLLSLSAFLFSPQPVLTSVSFFILLFSEGVA